jgi:hypothetical protein
MAEHLADYLDFNLLQRKSPRPMPMKIPPGAHVLSHSDPSLVSAVRLNRWSVPQA